MQPVSGDQYTIIKAAGTAVVSNQSAVVDRVVIAGTYVGTVALHDSASATGTSATSAVVTLGLPTTGFPQSLSIGGQFKNGITYEATGTPSMTVFWRK